uniref:Ig-like domain-containing protein n=1 Tax=Acanthochromis polyacanthus TaxID=80966 RepID=A0A3Q1GGV0_9TELE
MSSLLLTIYNLTHIGTSKANFNCLYSPLTTIHLPYGLTLTSPASEKGPLLASRGELGYYKLHTQGPLHSSGNGIQQLISSLTFIPQISIHKSAVFKCQVSYMGKDKIVEERVSEKLQPCGFSPPDVISMTVRASHFHPDVITFRWFCQGGELSPVASQASSSPRPNSEGFFSAFSQCKLPRSELERGAAKVWVSVHHIALRQPVIRETRGFIKRPTVSDIVSSTCSSDQTSTLGCEITDFYPPNISVTWLKLREGEQDDREEEVIEGGEMWGPIQTLTRLYRATATLKRRATDQDIKDRRGGIICRVEHCSLSIRPLSIHLLILIRVMGELEFIPVDPAQVTSLSHKETNNHTHIHTYGKPENPEEAHTCTGRTCKLHAERSQTGTQTGDLLATRRQC